MELDPSTPRVVARQATACSSTTQLHHLFDRVKHVEADSEHGPVAEPAPHCGEEWEARQPWSQRPAWWWARAKRECNSTATLLKEHQSILLVSVVLLVALVGLGLAGVLIASTRDTENGKEQARAVASEAALSIRQELYISTFGAEALAAYVTQNPMCSQLEGVFDALGRDILQRVGNTVIQQLEIDVAGVIWKTYPVLTGELADLMYGRDLLLQDSDRPGMIYALTARKMLILGPYDCAEGFKCAFTVQPLFLPAPDYSYDWGCGFQPFNCTDLCWDPVNKVKFHSQVSSMLNLDPLLKGEHSRLQQLVSQGYRYRLRQVETSFSNPPVQLAATRDLPRGAVSVDIYMYNLHWVLEIAPSSGWTPGWLWPCVAVVVVASLLVALLVFWLLVSRQQHDRLLRQMLPKKVIRQLQAGGGEAVVQEFDQVTVLFSDIVGYTRMASGLTPLQVVQLLNDLFSRFDELTAQHGVYKVETIGDSIMCVSGCPTPEDAPAAAARMARMALDMVRCVAAFKPPLQEEVRLKIRVGIHSGPVVAGVVGKKMPRYCLFGDTVNTASRMESTGEPMRVQVSAATAALLSAAGDFGLEPRGEVGVKGKGRMLTYWLGPPGHNSSSCNCCSVPPLPGLQSPAGYTTTSTIISNSASGELLATTAAGAGAGAGTGAGADAGEGAAGSAPGTRTGLAAPNAGLSCSSFLRPSEPASAMGCSSIGRPVSGSVGAPGRLGGMAVALDSASSATGHSGPNGRIWTLAAVQQQQQQQQQMHASAPAAAALQLVHLDSRLEEQPHALSAGSGAAVAPAAAGVPQPGAPQRAAAGLAMDRSALGLEAPPAAPLLSSSTPLPPSGGGGGDDGDDDSGRGEGERGM